MMAELFNNFQDIQNDTKMFYHAMQHFQNLQNEHGRLSLELETNKNFGKGAGRQVAAMVSGAIAGLVILIYLFFSFAV